MRVTETGVSVITATYNATLPAEGVLTTYASHLDFKATFTTIDMEFWVDLEQRDYPVTGWYELKSAEERRR